MDLGNIRHCGHCIFQDYFRLERRMVQNRSQVHRASSNESLLSPRSARIIPIMGSESGAYLRWRGADGMAGEQRIRSHEQQGERLDRRSKARQVKQLVRVINAGVFLFMVGAAAFVTTDYLLTVIRAFTK